ncbi:MAG: hypothetical protein QHH01_04680 [Spirochaetales bacterium]|nr:hypothetical protein [Spirochaetales bacterium]
MTTLAIPALVDGEILSGTDNIPVNGVYTSDLLSDVMAHGRSAEVLITIQAHNNTIAVASIVGIRLIVLCNGRQPDEAMLASARDEGIGIVRTQLSQFEVSGRLWKALHEQQ